MINSELNSNGLGNTGTVMPTCHKQPPIATKKAVLRDVQTINGSSVGNHPGLTFVEGRPLTDFKVSGTKRLIGEYPSSHTCPPPLSNDCPSWHPIYSRSKFESEAGKRRMPVKMDKYVDSPQSSQNLQKQLGLPPKKTRMRGSNMTHCLPVNAPHRTSLMTTSSYCAPSVPICLGNPDNGLPAAESDCPGVTSEVAHSVDSKEVDDDQRKEWSVNPQNFVKQCDTGPPPLSNDCPSWHPIYSRSKFESQAGKRRMPDKMDRYVDSPQSTQILKKQLGIPPKKTQMRGSNMTHCLPVDTPLHTSSMTTSSCAPSVPICHGNPDNGLPVAESDCRGVTSEVAHSVDSKEADDEQRNKRFINLQNFVKQCDETNKRDYILSILQHLSPAELSRHAVELEKRAIQLTIEEGKEMQRVKALNIFRKSTTITSPLQTSQKLDSKQ